MNEQVPSDEMTQNELICEKLLGWKRAVRGTLSGCQFWHTEPTQLRTLSFTAWDEAGLILMVMQREMKRPDILAELADGLAEGNFDPGSIRAAALEYIRSLP